MIKKIMLLFLLFNFHAGIYGMCNLVKKIKSKTTKGISNKEILPQKEHHSDKARDLRTPWMCECEMCADQLRAERENEEALLRMREPDILAPSPQQIDDQRRMLEVKREERRWQLRLAAEQTLMDYAERERAFEYTIKPKNQEPAHKEQKPKKKWEIVVGVTTPDDRNSVPSKKIFYSPEEKEEIERFLLEPYDTPHNYPMKMSFSDEDIH